VPGGAGFVLSWLRRGNYVCAVPRKSHRLPAVLLTIALGIACAGFWWLASRSNSIAFLPARPSAEWIVYPAPPNSYENPTVELGTEFRRSLVLGTAPREATLSVCGFRRFTVSVNGRAVEFRTPAENWKRPVACDLSRFLKAGDNEISITVFDRTGPPALWALLAGDGVILKSDESWQASYAGAAWKPARTASLSPPINPGNPLYGGETCAAALRKEAPVLVLFAALAVLLVALGRWWIHRGGSAADSSRDNRLWIAVGAFAVAWVVLWCNNLGALPALAGFDYAGHLQYVQFVLQRHTLPLATQGWEMYQPPLYYVISAAVLAILRQSVFDPGGIVALRLLGMVCGIAMFTMVFLSLRIIFPRRARPQFFGLMMAALLPANLYLCHYVTNEVLAAALSATSVYLCLRLLADPDVSLVAHAGLGFALGAALLTKSSTIVLPAVMLPVLGWNLIAKGVRAPAQWVRYLGTTMLAMLVVAGWHYARVAAHFGNPLIGNWDAAAGFKWWQDPGYRTASYYLGFGRSLSDPSYSACSSFADGIYSTLWGDGFWGGMAERDFRPPWNYDLMAAGYLFALLPTLAILIGGAVFVWRAVRNPAPNNIMLTGLVFLPLALLVYYSLKIPVYASAKAFYISSALVPVCVFAATGWDWLASRAGPFRLLFYVATALWAVDAYASFWIQGNSQATRILMARNLADQHLAEQAVAELLPVLNRDPSDAGAAALIADELLDLGRVPEAATFATQACHVAQENPDCWLALAAVLIRQGQTEGAVEMTRRAANLAPDSPIAFDKLSERLYAMGRNSEAVEACREALRVHPSSPVLHYRLGCIYSDLGDGVSATTQLRIAVELDPGLVAALDRLAWLLSTYPDAAVRDGIEAVRFASDAVRLSTPKSAHVLETLAAAYAEAGRFSDALATAQEALQTARAARDDGDALFAARLIDLFRSRQPCRTQARAQTR
jgi:tetratricopeptide (TPR) repeat protein